MTQEEKQLLLTDICARLPYGTVVERMYIPENNGYASELTANTLDLVLDDNWSVKPYLRPMSSMTKEETKYKLSNFFKIIDTKIDGVGYIPTLNSISAIKYIDWLNKNHFDYHGLIPMGLALEAPSDMYHNTNLYVVDTVDDIMYDIDSDNVEVIYKSGKKILHNIESLKLISSDERELGTEHDYLIEPNIHVVFYPEGHLSTFYFDEHSTTEDITKKRDESIRKYGHFFKKKNE